METVCFDQLLTEKTNFEIFKETIMDDSKYHFALFTEDDENMRDYIKRMRYDGEWSGHQELYAASQRFPANITP